MRRLLLLVITLAAAWPALAQNPFPTGRDPAFAALLERI